MSSMSPVDVDEVIDRQPLSRFNLGLWFWCFLLACIDGYDLTVISFVAPALVEHLTIDKASLGIIFSASLFGMAAGAPGFGWMGDRYGRKTAVIVGALLFGAATLGTLVCTTTAELICARLVTGVGLGGVIPNVIALTSEFAPKRFRARVLVLVGTGVPLGATVPGLLSAISVDWRMLLVIGGALPIALAVCSIWLLPESIKYLALHPSRRHALIALLRRIDPHITVKPAGADAATSIASHQGASISPARLFQHGLAVITPLLWTVFFTNLIVNFFVGNWMPLVLQGSGLTAEKAALIAAMYATGALFGSLALALWLGRGGIAMVAALFVLAVPAIASIGTPGLSVGALAAVVFLSGFSVGGIQTGLNAIAGLLYPTAIRAQGVAWALAIGRIGSILGPLVGGALIARQLPIEQMFRVPAVPMAIGAIAALILTALCYRQFSGFQVEEMGRERT